MKKNPKEPFSLKRFFSRTAVDRSDPEKEVKATEPQSPHREDETTPPSDMDRFFYQFVNPVVAAWREEDAANAQRELARENDTVHAISLPPDIWKRHILSRLPEQAMADFGEAYRSSPDMFNDFYNDRFKFKQFNPLPLFAKAKADGVNLNIVLLHNLCNKPAALQVIQPLHFEENVSWVIAAICGDINWLIQKHGKKFIELATKLRGYQRSIVFFLAFGGHFDLIKNHCKEILSANKKEQNQAISHVAASSGFFEISDYLQKEFETSANAENPNNGKTIAHYYAYYGDIARLSATIIVSRSLLTRFPRNKSLLFSAVAGGQIEMIKLLIQKRTDLLTQPDENFGNTCFHVAAQHGHAHVLKFFIFGY